MSLSTILDDIQDGAVKEQDSEVSDNVEQSDTSLEHLVGLPAVLNKAKVYAKEAFQQRALNQIRENTNLDMQTALELFTMLPISDGRQPILTVSPSAHNKRQILQYADKATPVTVDLIDFTSEILELVSKTLPVVQELVKMCDIYSDKIVENVNRLSRNRPIVVIDKLNVDLMDLHISMVSYIDTYKLQFTPYEGKLNVVFNKLFSSCLKFTETAKGGESLKSVAEFLLDRSRWIKRRLEILENSKAELIKISNHNKVTDYSQEVVDEVLACLLFIQEDVKIFSGSDSLASNCITCLDILV